MAVDLIELGFAGIRIGITLVHVFVMIKAITFSFRFNKLDLKNYTRFKDMMAFFHLLIVPGISWFITSPCAKMWFSTENDWEAWQDLLLDFVFPAIVSVFFLLASALIDDVLEQQEYRSNETYGELKV